MFNSGDKNDNLRFCPCSVLNKLLFLMQGTQRRMALVVFFFDFLKLFPFAFSIAASQKWCEYSKAHIPPAIRGHTTLIGKNEKLTNKRTDKQNVAGFFIHSKTGRF